MKASKTVSSTIANWLRGNNLRLNGLTSTDLRALKAAVQILDVYAYNRDRRLLEAFRAVLTTSMKPHSWHLAYHAIAHVMDWDDRARVWQEAGMPPIEVTSKCAYDPEVLNAPAALPTAPPNPVLPPAPPPLPQPDSLPPEPIVLGCVEFGQSPPPYPGRTTP